ncbi:MAG: aspartyl-tRNA(Asn)/glutamyl-tRNA(Gln) amidotransferase subunit [Patescibacteria group bacterium]|nr:aspartyl-tRNA(Asn)/glutamyl-tRNA(Gln) amidotransferase subunit [Patescibacteria group bacterium]
MKLKIEEIKHIAQLARLQLSEKELVEYQKELSSILDYVATLKEVDTTKVEPTAQIGNLRDVLRPDEVVPWDKEEIAAALKNNERENGNIKVKRVL